MTLFKRSLVCIAVVGLMAGCDDETKYVEVPSDYSPVVAEGKTLTNTPDVVVKGEATQADEVTMLSQQHRIYTVACLVLTTR